MITMSLNIPFAASAIDSVSVSINDGTKKVTITVSARNVVQKHYIAKDFTPATRQEVSREAEKLASIIRTQAGI